MNLIYRWRFLAAVSLLATVSLADGRLVAAGLVTADQRADQKSVIGSWKGDFGDGVWTFEFTRESSDWSGRYTYPGYNGWNRVINLSASPAAVEFEIRTDAHTKFDLRMEGESALVGHVTFRGGKMSSKRPVVVPVKLKRV